MEYLYKIKKFFIKHKRLMIFFVSMLLVLTIIEDVMDDDIISFDEKGYSIVEKYLIKDPITKVAKVITQFGGPILLLIIAIVFLIILRNKIGVSIFINLFLAALLNFTLKNILQRPRPIEHRIIDESGYSFPSGHSMVSMAFYGFILYLVYRFVKNKYIKWSLISAMTILIISIGVSRVYLGVHYTSDVIAGFLVAISYLVIYTKAIKEIVLENEEIYDTQNME